MADIPKDPKIYHLTHVGNLPGIVRDGMLWSDAERIDRSVDCQIVGMSEIKQRRLRKLAVPCHPETNVGQYVPFYFCPRSIMLYILYMGNHPDIAYRGGQRPLVHLVADLRAVIAWADSNNRRWAFSDCNAGAYYARFFCDLDSLRKVHWDAVEAADFRDARIKEGKQAEFLVHEFLPWGLVERIGVRDTSVKRQAEEILSRADQRPLVTVEREWYY